MDVSEGEGREKKMAGSLFKEIMAEKFPNLGGDTDIHIHETQWYPTQIQQKEDFP